MLATLVALHVLAAVPDSDPFAFFSPTVVLKADDRRHLARGAPVARVVQGGGEEVAVFAAIRVEIDGDRLVAWSRRVEALKKSAYVLAIARFSNPPRIEDLTGLVLDDDELSEIQKCRVDRCGLKLAAEEIRQLQGFSGPAMQQAFRGVVLSRVTAYLAGGEGALPASSARFGSLIEHSGFLTGRLPRLAEHLLRFPRTPLPEVESFVYWSKERLAGKAVIGVTHVSIMRGTEAGLPSALIAGKQIFATHYINASLGITTLIGGKDRAPAYVAYLNRSSVDVLGGKFGGLARWFMERRLKNEAADALQGLRRRLESGAPPAVAGRTPQQPRRQS